MKGGVSALFFLSHILRIVLLDKSIVFVEIKDYERRIAESALVSYRTMPPLNLSVIVKSSLEHKE
jgi:hypothetical protein